MTARLIAIVSTVLALAGCSKAPIDVEIPFVAGVGGHVIDCHGTSQAPRLTDLRFYVSAVQLVDSYGAAVPVSLTPDGSWQTHDLALLDLENGHESCDNGTAVVNSTLRGTVPAGDYRDLRFVLGVPFELNHRDPLQAAAPLGDAAMHWHWRGGYKFMRAGIQDGTHSYWLHLGSTGCEGKLQNITACSAPNRVTIDIKDFNPASDIVRVDLGNLFADMMPGDTAVTSCSSSPAEATCDAPFAALGLRAGPQQVFTRQAGR